MIKSRAYDSVALPVNYWNIFRIMNVLYSRGGRDEYLPSSSVSMQLPKKRRPAGEVWTAGELVRRVSAVMDLGTDSICAHTTLCPSLARCLHIMNHDRE